MLICPDNTVHQGLDLVRQRAPAPWVHIGEEVSKEAHRHGFKRVAILGTRFLMEGPVYPPELARAGCDAVVLGCTEIPLLVTQTDSPLPVLDSTRILARAGLREATSAERPQPSWPGRP